MRLSNLGLAAAVVIAFAGTASAADMSPMPMKAPMAPPAPVANWTGCYLDGGVGYGLYNQDHSVTNTGVTTVTSTDGGRGWLGRLGAGCDYQFAPKWVIGAFGDYDFMSLKGTLQPNEVFAGSSLTGSEKESSAWAVGARIGFLVTPNILTYFDGGYTQSRFDQVNLLLATGAATTFAYPAHTYSGWFLGSGFDFALSDFFGGLPRGLYTRTEYRFADYGRDDLAEFITTSGALTGNVMHSEKFVHTVTTSLVWRFW